MTNVVRMRRKPRPLQKAYSTTEPYVVSREDHSDGSITYEIYDERPDSYRFVCGISEHDNEIAMHDARQIARGLNLLVQYGQEKLPPMRDDV